MILDQQDYIDSPDLPSVKNRRSNMKNEPLKSSEHKVFRGIAGQPNWVVQGTQRDIVIRT